MNVIKKNKKRETLPKQVDNNINNIIASHEFKKANPMVYKLHLLSQRRDELLR